MSTPAETKPWELSPLVQAPVKLSEVFALYLRKRPTFDAELVQMARTVFQGDIMRLRSGTGYYRRKLSESQVERDADMIKMGHIYFGLDFDNIQILLCIGPERYDATYPTGFGCFVRIAPTLDQDRPPSEYPDWFFYTEGYPIPIDRMRLSELINQFA